MDKLSINIENCYGIRKLNHTFDFTSRPTYVIYAPNGTMKTSFAKTLGDIASGNTPTDLMFPNRQSVFLVRDQAGKDIVNEEIFVIDSYNDQFTSERMTTLLVNKKLKKRYDTIHSELNHHKDNLVKKLQQLSGIKSNVEELICRSFSKNNLFEVTDMLGDGILQQVPKFANIPCSELFNDKVLSLLKDKSVSQYIHEYIDKFNELLSKSKYFKSGFNHYHASTIQKTLKDNGFFKAKHSINLLDLNEKKQEILTEDEFSSTIKSEMDSIINDAELSKKWREIDKKLSANAEHRAFRDYLFQYKELLPELAEVGELKKNFWISYFIDQKDLYLSLLNSYKTGKEELAVIIEEAKKQETQWKEVINIFNRRFTVPFDLVVQNQEDVILNGKIPNIKFVFHDTEHTGVVDKDELLKALSTGEKRALYILNIIFEVEARRHANQKTIFIVDDIADSFDYKNKYAIIEYLKEITETRRFYQIILTHNFDFYRTISRRFNLVRGNRLYVIKKENSVSLVEERYQNDPFKVWKEGCTADSNMLIASIPFVRNLLEYTKGDQDPGYLLLTGLLHIKTNTSTIVVNQVYGIINSTLNMSISINDGQFVKDLIYNQSSSILAEGTDSEIDLEKKIVLSIAIRLKAEEFMINKINDTGFVNTISSNQTYELYKKYRHDFPHEDINLKILGRVNLMTAENIHLNSFMYEPILDMADKHLRQLYADVERMS